MAQFNLTWDNTNIISGTNTISVRASYRKKGDTPWIQTGFTPANDMPKTTTSCVSPNTLSDNTIYQFKLETICTYGGPTSDADGILEQIHFACITPTLSKTDTSATITLDVTDLDITKARFTLRKTSDSSIVISPTVIVRAGDSITYTANTLNPSTSYFWQVELYATVNSVEVISSASNYINSVCGPYTVVTNDPPTCDNITSLTVSSVNS